MHGWRPSSRNRNHLVFGARKRTYCKASCSPPLLLISTTGDTEPASRMEAIGFMSKPIQMDVLLLDGIPCGGSDSYQVENALEKP